MNSFCQISVRGLHKLTLVVSILLTIGVLCSRYFDEHALPWLFVSFVPVVAVWFCRRSFRVSRQATQLTSVAIFFGSLLVPALTLGGDLLLGFMAVWLGFLGMFSEWQISKFQSLTWYPPASAMGTIANVAFVISHAFVFSHAQPWGITVGRRCAIIGTAMALLVLIPLALSGNLLAIYPGYGLWVASLFVLVVGLRRD